LKTIKAGSVNSFEATGIGDKGTSKQTGQLRTPKISMAPGFGKAKIVK